MRVLSNAQVAGHSPQVVERAADQVSDVTGSRDRNGDLLDG
jgi:hypothetical protein